MFKCCSFRACICIMLMCNLISNLIYFRKFYIYRTHVSKNAELKWLWTHQEEIADSWLVWSQTPASVNATPASQHLDLVLGKDWRLASPFPNEWHQNGAWRKSLEMDHVISWTFLVVLALQRTETLCKLFPKNWSSDVIAHQQDTKFTGCSNILSRCSVASGCLI